MNDVCSTFFLCLHHFLSFTMFFKEKLFLVTFYCKKKVLASKFVLSLPEETK